MIDTRYVYGARCTWHGPISAVGRRQSGGHTLPCCPHCLGMLFEYPNKATWDNGVRQFDEKRPGYKEFTEWLGSYGRCWPTLQDGVDAYNKITGKDFTIGIKD